MKERIKRAFKLLLSLGKKESSRIAKSEEAKQLMKEFKDGAKEGEAKLKQKVNKLRVKATTGAKKVVKKTRKTASEAKKAVKRVVKKKTVKKVAKKRVSKKKAVPSKATKK